MQEQLDHILFNEGFVKKTDRMVCAVSGGADSMVLLHLLHNIGIDTIVAHCNFNLRGSESDEDEHFVSTTCQSLHIPFFVKHFQTTQYAKEHQLSIQEAARRLRYNWFEEVRSQENCAFIATAHNKTDHLETVFINQIRGTGLIGLTGIPFTKGHIIRPLLSFTSKDIRSFAAENNISYRNDSSNQDSKYLRNVIRKKIVSSLLEIEPKVEDIILRNSQELKQYDDIISHITQNIKHAYFSGSEEIHTLPIERINSYPHPHIILYKLLADYGFNYTQLKDISSTDQSGSYVQSETHTFSRDRDHYILQSNQPINTNRLIIQGLGTYRYNDKTITVELVNKSGIKFPLDNNVCVLDPSTLKQSIEVRSWQQKDSIQPLGMKGRKLLSDVFIDLKVPNAIKPTIPICCVNNEICWVAQCCFSEKFKIDLTTDQPKTLLKLTVS